MTFLGIEPQAWLGFSVVGTFVSVCGTLLATLIKDLWLADKTEKRAERRALRKLLQRYSEPLILAADDLVRRLEEINARYPPDYLVDQPSPPPRMMREKTARIDAHFNHYKWQSTLYRFASFLGWIECFRREMSFMQLTQSDFANQFNDRLEEIRRWMSDGALNEKWQESRDCLIYREEIRAIGECMIVSQGEAARIMGYAQFCEDMDQDTSLRKWVDVLGQFLGSLSKDSDFRQTRLLRLQGEVANLQQMLRNTKPPRRSLNKLLASKSKS